MMDDLPRELEENSLQARLDRAEKRSSQLQRRHNALSKAHTELEQRVDDLEESLAEVTAANRTLNQSLRYARQYGALTRLIQQRSQGMSQAVAGSSSANRVLQEFGAAWERILASEAPETVADETISGWRQLLEGPSPRSLPPRTSQSSRW